MPMQPSSSTTQQEQQIRCIVSVGFLRTRWPATARAWWLGEPPPVHPLRLRPLRITQQKLNPRAPLRSSRPRHKGGSRSPVYFPPSDDCSCACAVVIELVDQS